MDSHSPKHDPAAAEDYVHVEDPNPSVESLSDSFVGVDDVRTDDDAVSRGGDSEGFDQSRTLPEELSRSVAVLSCESSAEGGRCDVYLVGTAHVSQESCREVQAVINYLKPEVVFLELCSQRVAVLTPQNLKVPTFGEMVEMWKKKHNLFGILYSWFLSKVASKLEVFPGAEFRVAFEEAMKYGVIQEMSKEFPTLMETLLRERDQYMSSTLLKIASEHSSVVAVVGKGHMNGIKKHWQQPLLVKDLLVVPSSKSPSAIKVLTSFGIAAAGVAIVTGIYLRCKK